MVASRAIEFEPDKRYQSAADMLMDLKLAIKRCKSPGDPSAGASQTLESQEGVDPSGNPR